MQNIGHNSELKRLYSVETVGCLSNDGWIYAWQGAIRVNQIRFGRIMLIPYPIPYLFSGL